MEWLLVALAFMVFIVIPPCMVYDMIKESKEEPGLLSDIVSILIPMLLTFIIIIPLSIGLYIWFALAAIWRGIAWTLTGEWMCKDRWWERKSA